MFGDPLARIGADPRHSFAEERLVLPGRSHRRRILAVIYVDKGDLFRIISAQIATRAERRDYEEAIC